MACLRKLIVIDSYAASRIREVNLAGHVHVAGRNGRGKTTLIRLVPLFYGEQPSRVVRTSGSVVRSLKEFMFSRSTSYVAFEYENHDGVKLAILHYAADGPQYHLADGAFSRDLFTENGELIEARHLYARLRTLGRNPSAALGVMQYRAVIQGVSSRTVSADLRGLIRRFALVPGRSRLGGIERISSGMFSKDITFTALKRMAAEVASEDENTQITLALSRRELESFLPEFKAYRAVMDLRTSADEAQLAYIQANQARHERSVAAGRLRRLVLALGELHQLRRTELEAAEDALAALKREKHDVLAALDRERDANAETIARLEASIRRADEEEQAWKSQGIADLQALVDRRAQIDAQVAALGERQQALVAKADSVTRKYQALFAEEKTRRAALVAEAKEQLNDRLHALTLEIEAIGQQREARLAALHAAQELEEDQAQSARQAAADEVSRLDQAIGDLQPDPELAAAALRAKHILDAAQAGLEQALVAEGAAKAAIAQAESEEARCAHELVQAKQKLEHAQDRLGRLMALESPPPGSLLAFLRSQHPDWHEDIAKVIREDLLLREDLLPALGEGESLYGLLIDLPAIEAGRATNEAQLSAEIGRARAAVETLSGMLATLHRDHASRVAVAEAARAASREQMAAVSAARAHAGACRADHEAAVRRQDEERSARRADLLAARKEASAVMAARQQSFETLRKHHRDVRHACDAEFGQRVAQVRDQQTAARRTHEEACARLEDERRKAQAGLDRLRLKELADQGIDTDALALLEGELHATQAEASRARKAAPVVEAYQRWLLSVPPQRETDREALRESISCGQTLQQRRAETAARFAAREESQNAALSTIRQQERELRHRLSDAETAQQARLAGIDAEPAEDPDRTAAHWQLPVILGALDEAGTRLRETESRLRRLIGTLMKTFRRPDLSATKVGEFAANFPEDYAAELHRTLDVLSDWYATAHAQQRDVLLGALRNGGGILKRFQDGLLAFQSNIAGLSRQLQSSLDADMVFEAIQGLSLRLSAQVERRPYWDALTRLLEAFDGWQQDGFGELPDKTLLDELQDFARYLPDGTLAENPETLIDMEIEVNDGTDTKRVCNEADLKQVSSNGLSYLVLCLIFVAFANRARQGADLWLTWALDEIGTIDEANSKALLQMLDRNQIRLVSASPEAKEALQALFEYRYQILPDFEIQRIANDLPAWPGELEVAQ